MTVYMFPGQGSQEKGMGREVFDVYPEYVQQANNLLGYDIKALCLEDQQQLLSLTEYTQPALYVVSSLMCLKVLEEERVPQYLIGHSVGEYTALFAAQCFDFLTGLSLVMKRSKLMSRAKGGAMLAITGLKIEAIKEFLSDNQLNSIDVANHNSLEYVVVSGPKEDIQRAESVFAKKARMCVQINVSGAFHSRYMEDAKDQFSEYIKNYHFKAPEIPVIANFTAEPYEGQDIAYNLVNQITGTVRWVESIHYLMGLGEQSFQQIGPGKVLPGMIRRIKQEQVFSVEGGAKS